MPEEDVVEQDNGDDDTRGMGSANVTQDFGRGHGMAVGHRRRQGCWEGIGENDDDDDDPQDDDDDDDGGVRGVGKKGMSRRGGIMIVVPTSNDRSDGNASSGVNTTPICTTDDAKTTMMQAPTDPPLPPQPKTNMGSYHPLQSSNNPHLHSSPIFDMGEHTSSPPMARPPRILHPARPMHRTTTIGSLPPFSTQGNPMVVSVSPYDPAVPILQPVPSACRLVAWAICATGQHNATPYGPA
ncbi:uncharacterized protein EV420DRAFT_1485561 [Desarmillaria tabescens]|uniref:Uncharacterized protein n=1 Tax=Armillaria tabescens TaxID=1929756 RepID=A0AA39MQ65_ARMTA|nr:uncharacterized protein EV420DRAFT_1485561 [Desarmillaria tabescens]KAK0441725.1 hypothetical protein EV420DRAFT_1485561 [Desarmillaria tabescens]